jgi:NADH-dependent peroxiredoxin subunit F
MFGFELDKHSDQHAFDTVPVFDFLVIGAGPAGLNAALYAARKGMATGVIGSVGGQLHNTTSVDNYLGFPLIGGKEMSDRFFDHLSTLDVPVLTDRKVTSLTRVDGLFLAKTDDGKTRKARTVLIATGGSSRTLGVPGEETYRNKGVSYCTTCDAPFFKDKDVIVAGGGNSAAEAVIDLVPWASTITVVHRSQWRADGILLEKHKEISNLTVHLQTQILSVDGKDKMTGITVLDKTTNSVRTIKADGIFIEIGTVPNSTLVRDLVETDIFGQIIADRNQMTSVPGLFAAGDVTDQPHKQIIISVAEGAKAALAAHTYLIHQTKEGHHATTVER